MAIKTIAIIGTGDMGSAVGRVLREQGYRIITDPDGRSDTSRELARQAGFENLDGLEAVVSAADLFLSILPPAAAGALAGRVAAALRSSGEDHLIYADCNAVSPAGVRRIAAQLEGVCAGFVDAGIVGPPPGKSPQPTRFYVSGPDAGCMAELHGKGLDVRPLGADIGRASALKMAYASLNKGTIALRTAVLMAAQRLGVGRELQEELQYSQAAAYEQMCRSVPFLGAVARRWEGEMHEIEDTFRAAGITGDFHAAAASIYSILADSELGGETRGEQPQHRDLEAAIDIFLRTAPPASGDQS